MRAFHFLPKSPSLRCPQGLRNIQSLNSRAKAASARPLWKLLLLGGLVLFALASPTHADERRLFHDSLALGYGFDPESARQFPSPLASLTAVRTTSGDPKFEFELIQNSSGRHQSNGSSLDISIEGRYAAYRGKSSFSFEQSQENAQYDFSFTLRESYDFGDYRIPNIRLKPAAYRLWRQGFDNFIKYYGRECVVGESRQTYLLVNYRVHRLSNTLQQRLGLAVDAEGSWGVGSASLSANWQSTLKSIAQESAIEVRITASVGNVDLRETIKNPNDVDTVLQQMANLSLQLNQAQPSARGFIVEKWENLINFTQPASKDASPDPYWKQQMDELAKMSRLETRILGYQEGALSTYLHLVPMYVDPVGHTGFLDQSLVTIRDRKTQIQARLERWKADPNLVSIEGPTILFDPILVNWPAIFWYWDNLVIDQSGHWTGTGTLMGVHHDAIQRWYVQNKDTKGILDLTDNSHTQIFSNGRIATQFPIVFKTGAFNANNTHFEIIVLNSQGAVISRADLPVPGG